MSRQDGRSSGIAAVLSSERIPMVAGTQPPVTARLRAVIPLAVHGLPQMRLGDRREYAQTVRAIRTPAGAALRAEGSNLRYAAIVALGTGRMSGSGQREALAGTTAADHPLFAELHLDHLEARQAAGFESSGMQVLPILENAWSGDGASTRRRAMLAAARLLGAPRSRVVAAVVAAIDAAEWQESPLWCGRVRVMAARALGSVSPADHADQVAKVALSDVPKDRDEHRRALLGEAVELFDECGATALARLARTSLDEVGADAGSAEPGTSVRPPRLTKDEERVATMVVRGATNRQVASTTYVSVRTVELRLTSIYRKLGIRSRKELPDAMAALAESSRAAS